MASSLFLRSFVTISEANSEGDEGFSAACLRRKVLVSSEISIVIMRHVERNGDASENLRNADSTVCRSNFFSPHNLLSRPAHDHINRRKSVHSMHRVLWLGISDKHVVLTPIPHIAKSRPMKHETPLPKLTCWKIDWVHARDFHNLRQNGRLDSVSRPTFSKSFTCSFQASRVTVGCSRTIRARRSRSARDISSMLASPADMS